VPFAFSKLYMKFVHKDRRKNKVAS
jgi:hypothetical protein